MVIMGEFIGRNDLISPVSIKFHVRYVSPTIQLKFEGRSDIQSLSNGRIAIARIKANKSNEYNLDLILGKELDKIEIGIETRGKLSVSMQSASLYTGETTRLKLRYRGI